MMSYLYPEDEVTFDKSGFGPLPDMLESYAEEEANSYFELYFEYPLFSSHERGDYNQIYVNMSDYLIEGNQVTYKPSHSREPHAFRIYKTEKQVERGIILVWARTRTADLRGNPVRKVKSNGASVSSALRALKLAGEETHPFSFTTNIQSNIDFEKTQTNVLDALAGEEDSILAITGGQMIRTNNNIYIGINESSKNIVEFRLGKNIEGISYEVDYSNVVTAVIPFYTQTYKLVDDIRDEIVRDSSGKIVKNADGTTKYNRTVGKKRESLDKEVIVYGDTVFSPYANDYSTPFYSFVEIRDDREDVGVDKDPLPPFTKTDINNRAIEWFNWEENLGVDEPEVSVTVDVHDISQSSEYSHNVNLAKLEMLNVFDKALVYVPEVGIDMDMEINYIRYDGVAEKNLEVRLGTTLTSLTETVLSPQQRAFNERVQQLDREIEKSLMSSDGKSRVYWMATKPVGQFEIGDLWFDISLDGGIYVWDGYDWVAKLPPEFGKLIEESVNNAIEAAESAMQEAQTKADKALLDAKAYADAQDKLITQQVTTSVNTAISTAEAAKVAAKTNADQALADAKAHAIAQDKLITQQVNTSVGTALSTAQAAKTAAESSYTNAVAEAERLVGVQTTAFNAKFEENTTAMGTLSQAAKDADAKAQSALTKAGANANVLTTHQNTIDTIKTVTLPDISSTAGTALANAKSAMDEAKLADGKIANYVTTNGLVSGTTVDTKINEATGEISKKITTVEGKIPTKIGGRNYLLNSGKPNALNIRSNNYIDYPLTKGVTNGVDWISQAYSNGSESFIIFAYFSEVYSNESLFGSVFSNELLGYTGDVTYSVDVMSEQPITVSLNSYGEKTKLEPNKWTRISVKTTIGSRPYSFTATSGDNIGIPAGAKLYWKNYKIEKGNIATDYSPAPEDNLSQSEFQIFESTYDEDVKGINSTLTDLSTKKLDGTTYTTFYDNEYKKTAQGVTDTYAKVNKIIDKNGNSTDTFAKAVYDRNATRQSADFKTVTDGLVKTATYTAGINGINGSIATIRGNLDSLIVGGENLILNSSFENDTENWTLYRGLLEKTSGIFKFDGTSHNFIRLDASGNTVSDSRVETDVILDSKTEYVISAYIHRRVYFIIEEYDTDGNRTQRIEKSFYGNYNRENVVFTTKEKTSYVRVVFQSKPGDHGLVSLVKLERGNIPTAWSKSPQEQLGKADFQIFKGEYESNDKEIQARLTAIDSGKEGSVVTRLNATEKTAGENKNTISKVNKIVTIQDTRTDNQPPKWYRDNYPRTTVQEFKEVTAIRDSNIPFTSGYGVLNTSVIWSHTSGGTIQQVFTQNDKRYVRRGYSDDSGWSPWVKMTDQEDIKNFVDSTSTEYQTITERSNLYERVIGKDESGVKSNISRIVQTSEIIQQTVTSAMNVENRNLLITKDATKDSRLTGSEGYPKPSSQPNSGTSTSPDLIEVKSGDKFTLSKNETTLFFRVIFLNSSKKYIGRYVQNAKLGTITPPSGTAYIWASYPTNADAKIEKGSIATGYSPAPEDTATQSQVTQLQDSWSMQLTKADDVVTQINATSAGVLIQGKNLILDGNVTMTSTFSVPNANIKDLAVNKITGTTAQFTALVTKGLVADVITSTMIKADDAMFTKLFTNSLATTKLAAQSAWITNAAIASLDASKITTGTIAAARINAALVVSSGLVANVVKSTHIESSTALVEKIFATDAYVTTLTSKTIFATNIKAITIDASKITSGTIAAARINAALVVSTGLVANVVKSTHLEAGTALVDRIFSDTAYITQLTSKTAFISSIQAISINASKITSGTLDASKVTVTNIDASKITANKTSFVQSVWNALNSTISIDGNGIRSANASGDWTLYHSGAVSFGNSKSQGIYLEYAAGSRNGLAINNRGALNTDITLDLTSSARNTINFGRRTDTNGYDFRIDHYQGTKVSFDGRGVQRYTFNVNSDAQSHAISILGHGATSGYNSGSGISIGMETADGSSKGSRFYFSSTSDLVWLSKNSYSDLQPLAVFDLQFRWGANGRKSMKTVLEYLSRATGVNINNIPDA